MKLFSVGCSFTEGSGLKRQDLESYSHKLGTKLKLEYYNFGSSGASNDYIFRKIFELINSNTITKEDIILIQWTHYLRKELATKYKKLNFFHYLPNSFHTYDDKIIVNENYQSSVQGIYKDIKDIYLIKNKLETKNKEYLQKYIIDFIQEDYQLNTTTNYINSLYTYLEYHGFKHIHFFGWDDCIIDSIFNSKTNFIKESFAKYTSTLRNEHPNKEGHEMWADFLYEKINEFNYLDTFKSQIDNYRKELLRLNTQIELNLEISDKKIKEQQRINLDNEINKIKNIKLKEMEEELKQEKIKLDELKEEIKNEIIIQRNNLKKPKTLI